MHACVDRSSATTFQMQRSKRVQVKQLNHRSLVNLLLSPAFLAAAQAESLAAWCHAQALAAFLLPRKCIVTTLYILNNGTGDLLAYLTAQPTNKMQVRSRQGQQAGSGETA